MVITEFISILASIVIFLHADDKWSASYASQPGMQYESSDVSDATDDVVFNNEWIKFVLLCF